MHLRLPVISAAASVAIAAGLGIGTSTAASARLARADVPAVVASETLNTAGVTPDVNNVWLYPNSKSDKAGSTAKACIRGADDTVAADPSHPVKSVMNNCEYSVTLQQVLGGASGWTHCIEPVEYVNIPSADQIPHGIRIGPGASC